MNGFVANLYELFGDVNLEISKIMEEKGFYSPIFIFMLVSVIVISLIYYYPGHPRINRWYHWLLINLGACILNFIVTWIITSDNIVAIYKEFNIKYPEWTNYFTLGSIAFFWTFVFFFIFSFIIKWWSRNCKHSPFI